MIRNTKQILVALAATAMLAALAAPAFADKCPGPWDAEDINQWQEISHTHLNTCASPAVAMDLEGLQKFMFKMKDCGDGTFKISKHVNHGKVYARAQRRIPEGHEGYVASDSPDYVTEAQLEAWLADHPVDAGDERPMPAGWYETIWNSNGITNVTKHVTPGAPNNVVFICHFVGKKNPYTGVKEDYLFHLNQHWTFNEGDPPFEFQNVNNFITCPGQGGTMTKICYPDVDPNCQTDG